MEYTLIEGATSVEAVLKAESRITEKILIDKDMSERKKFSLYPLLRRAERMCVNVEYVAREEIDSLSSGKTHGGVIAYVGERKYKDETELYEKKNGYFVMLDGVEDPFNFGQALRAIYASGADGIILPERNWMTASAVVARSSAGASEYIDAYICEDTEKTAEMLSEKGYRIVCTDHTDKAVSMTKANLKRPLLLIIGGEKRGISAKLKSLSDTMVKIDYGRDFNASLGAAEASAILAFEVLRQNTEDAK